MDIFSSMVSFGQSLLTGMSSLFDFLNTKISDLLADILPEAVVSTVTNLPIVGLVTGHTLIDLILGVGVPIVIGYSLIKWLIP